VISTTREGNEVGENRRSMMKVLVGERREEEDLAWMQSSRRGGVEIERKRVSRYPSCRRIHPVLLSSNPSLSLHLSAVSLKP